MKLDWKEEEKYMKSGIVVRIKSLEVHRGYITREILLEETKES